jgi:hypothetical protein
MSGECCWVHGTVRISCAKQTACNMISGNTKDHVGCFLYTCLNLSILTSHWNLSYFLSNPLQLNGCTTAKKLVKVDFRSTSAHRRKGLRGEILPGLTEALREIFQNFGIYRLSRNIVCTLPLIGSPQVCTSNDEYSTIFFSRFLWKEIKVCRNQIE